MIETVVTQQMSQAPTALVSVLLPAWNEADMIGRCLDSLLTLEWPDLEIIVCAGGTDATYQIARAYESDCVVILEQQTGEGKQGALRRCFAHASGDIIYLTDADCIVPNDVFLAVIEPVLRREAVASTGTSRPIPEQLGEPFALFQWSIRRASERRRSQSSSGLLGRNCAVTRGALLQAGAFAADVPIGTDYHLAKTLLAQGNEIRFVPAAVHTSYPLQSRQFLHQQSRWLRNIFLHGPRFGDYDEILACARTIGLGAGFLLWPLGWGWTRLPGFAIWLIAFGLLVNARSRYMRQLATEANLDIGVSHYVRLPWYTLVDVTSWASPLFDLVTRRRRLHW